MYQAIEPDAESSSLFMNLLPAPVHSFLQNYGSDPGVIILGAIENKALLGALSARRNWREPTDCDIECLLVVSPGSDDSGVERFLLEMGEARIKARGFRRLQFAIKVPRRDHGENSLLTLLEREGWDRPRLQWTRFYSKSTRVRQEKWYRLEIPEGYDLFPWSQLTVAERDQLAVRAACAEDTRYLDPLVVENFDGSTSLGVRKRSDGSVVGWMITEPVSPALLCFKRLYIMPDERAHGLFHPLLANSVKLMLEQGWSGTFTVESDNEKMCEVLIRMLGRHCLAILDCFYCSKRLVLDAEAC